MYLEDQIRIHSGSKYSRTDLAEMNSKCKYIETRIIEYRELINKIKRMNEEIKEWEYICKKEG